MQKQFGCQKVGETYLECQNLGERLIRRSLSRLVEMQPDGAVTLTEIAGVLIFR